MSLPSQGTGKDAPVTKQSRLLWSSIVVGVSLLAMVGLGLWGLQPSAEEWLRQAEKAMAHADYVAAEQLAQRALSTSPELPAALLIAGQAAMKRGQIKKALKYYDQLENDGGREAIQGLYLSADLLLRDGGRLSEAERRYRQALAGAPDALPAHFGLMTLLTIEGRRWESVPVSAANREEGQRQRATALPAGRLGSRRAVDYLSPRRNHGHGGSC